jgi:hypothetical protein
MEPDDDFDTTELDENLIKLKHKIKRWDELTGGKPKPDQAVTPPAPPVPTESPVTE